MLPLVFANKADYDKISKGDLLTIADLNSLKAGQPVTVKITKKDGSSQTIELNHSMNSEQIRWFKAGSAMNAVNAPKAAL